MESLSPTLKLQLNEIISKELSNSYAELIFAQVSDSRPPRHIQNDTQHNFDSLNNDIQHHFDSLNNATERLSKETDLVKHEEFW